MDEDSTRLRPVERYFWSSFIVVGALTILGAALNLTTPLIPLHTQTQFNAGLSAAAIAMPATTMALPHVALRKGLPIWAIRIVVTFAAGFLAFMAAMVVSTFLFGFIDFPPGRTAQDVRMLPLGRAWVSGGRGCHYKVRLREYASDFCVQKEDFESSFGKTGSFDASSFCLRATVQQNGAAIRVMHASSYAFTWGSLVRCANGTNR